MAVFPQTFGVEYSHRMAVKLGMATFDGDFTTALLALMKRDKVDFTNLFRALSGVTTEGPGEDGTEEELLRPVEGVLPEGSVKGDWAQWMRIYIVKVGKRSSSCVCRLERTRLHSYEIVTVSCLSAPDFRVLLPEYVEKS